MEPKFVIIAVIFLISIIIILLWNRYRNLKLLKTVTSPDRGTWSEQRLIIKLLKLGIPPQTIFHDLYVKRPSGNYSQIDVVVPTRTGIIVFEVKDYSGWLFGKGYQSHWCQVLAYGSEKHRFYNPVKQNETHIVSLQNDLSRCVSSNTPIYSVIVFYGNCVFKNISGIPDNTFVIKPRALSDVIHTIQSRDTDAHYLDRRGVVRLLREAVANGENSQIVAQHRQMVLNIANRN